jgi:hypothetical protein
VDTYDEYMHGVEGHMMKFLLDIEHEFLPGTDGDYKPKSLSQHIVALVEQTSGDRLFR